MPVAPRRTARWRVPAPRVCPALIEADLAVAFADSPEEMIPAGYRCPWYDAGALSTDGPVASREVVERIKGYAFRYDVQGSLLRAAAREAGR